VVRRPQAWRDVEYSSDARKSRTAPARTAIVAENSSGLRSGCRDPRHFRRTSLLRHSRITAAGALAGDLERAPGCPSAFHGGAPTALLGLAIHYFITFVWATLFVVSSLKFPVLSRYAIVTGTLYGLLIYAAMNYAVLPLSRQVGHPAFSVPVLVNAVFADPLHGTTNCDDQ
jgi:hypothetical protein